METIQTQYFEIHYHKELESFIQDSISIFNKSINQIKSVFARLPKQKVKASFFINRQDFVKHIQSISDGRVPPDWATGCFYNGEIQTLVDINNKEALNYNAPTLTHEFVHLCFNSTIYNKYNISRIRWLDESYADYLDGCSNPEPISEYKNLAKKLKPFKNFNVNILDDINKVSTKEYNGYDMFAIIGKYIFDNNLAKEYIKQFIINQNTIIDLGKTILSKAIKYIENL